MTLPQAIKDVVEGRIKAFLTKETKATKSNEQRPSKATGKNYYKKAEVKERKAEPPRPKEATTTIVSKNRYAPLANTTDEENDEEPSKEETRPNKGTNTEEQRTTPQEQNEMPIKRIPLPQIYEGETNKAKSFIKAIDEYATHSGEETGLGSPIKKAKLTLNLMRGQKVREWVKEAAEAIDALHPTTDDVPAIWTSFKEEFAKQFEDANSKEQRAPPKQPVRAEGAQTAKHRALTTQIIRGLLRKKPPTPAVNKERRKAEKCDPIKRIIDALKGKTQNPPTHDE